MISHGTGKPSDQPLYDRLWGSGFLPTRVPGREVPRPAATRCSTSRIRRASTGDAPPPMLDDLGKLNQMQARAIRRPGDRHAHRAVRDGVPDADVGAGADRPLERAAEHVSSCTARTRASRARSPRTACWPGGWSSAACASSSSSTAAGTSTATCRSRLRGQCKDTDQASAALDQGPEAARPARRHAGRLGRRVRPHRLLPGQAHRGRLRPRPPSALLHDVDGRRRHQAGHHLRRDRRLLLQHRSRTRSTSTT